MESRADDVRAVVAAHLPGYRVDAVAPLGAGLDNQAYEVNGELVVRFARGPGAAVRVEREARLLVAVAGVAPLAVPTPRFTDPGYGCLAYDRLPGVPLLSVPPARWPAHAASVATTLGRFLAALHAVPPDRVAGLVERDDTPPQEWRDDATGSYAAVVHAVPAAYRPAVAAFLDSPPPAAAPGVFCHHDLGIEHVLVEPATGAVTGVIDWSDAAVADPAADVGRLFRDLGPVALDAVLAAIRADDVAAVRRRAVFYARCGMLEDLAYGLATGRSRYVDKSLAAQAWLFA